MEAKEYLKIHNVKLNRAETAKVLLAMEDYRNQTKPLLEFETIDDIFIKKWNEAKKEKGLNGAIRILGKAERGQIMTLQKSGYTIQQIIEAFKNAMNDEYHKGTNYKYLTPEFMTRPDKFNRFINETIKPNIETGDYGYQ